MERLKGKTILIGKEPGQGRLAVVVGGKAGLIGAPGSVPGCVSRLKDGTGHCQITVGHDGSLTIKNLKEANVTYVNGATIVSKRIDLNSLVELGKDHYVIDVKTVLQAAAKLLPQVVPPPPPVKEFSIKHLERVWNNYHDGNIEIKKRCQNLAASQSFTPILTLGSTAISAVAAPLNLGLYIWPVTVPLIVIGVCLMVRNYNRRKNDTSIEDSEKLLEEFQRNYVCPNPDCKRFFGNQSYTVIRQQKICPLCKCKYNEK